MKRTLIMVTALVVTLAFGSMEVNAQEVSDRRVPTTNAGDTSEDPTNKPGAEQREPNDRSDESEETRKSSYPKPTLPSLQKKASIFATPISTEDLAAPAKHFADSDYPIPILMDYSGEWINQYGSKMELREVHRYLERYPDYCAAVLEINSELTDIETDRRTDELDDYANSINEVAGQYDFIEETIDKFRNNGIYLLMAMSPYRTETIMTCLEQSDYTAEPIPIYRKDGSWVDQFGKTMVRADAEAFFQKHQSYKEALDKVQKFARQAKIDNDQAFSEMQKTYNAWFMWQVREDYGITNAEFYNITAFSESSHHEAWSLIYLINDYNQIANRYLHLSLPQYEEAALKRLKASPDWCENCYEIYSDPRIQKESTINPTPDNPDGIRKDYCKQGHPVHDFEYALEKIKKQLAESAIK